MGFLNILKGATSLIPGVGPLVSGGIGVAESLLQRKGASKAQKEQELGIDQAIDETRAGSSQAQQIARQYQAETNDANSPFLQAGYQGVNTAATLLDPNGEIGGYRPDQYTAGRYDPAQYQGEAPTFNFDPSKVQMDPGFERRAQRGSEAILAARAAMGGLASGATGKRLIDYNQDVASDEYGKAYGRAYQSQADTFNSKVNQYADTKDTFIGNRNANTDAFKTNETLRKGAFDTNVGNIRQNQQDRLNSLMDLTKTGQQAASEDAAANRTYGSESVNAARQAASDIANLRTNKGDVRAAGLANKTNAITGGVESFAPLIQSGIDRISRYDPNDPRNRKFARQ